MGIQNTFDEIITALDHFQANESHCVNKHGELTDYEVEAWKHATKRYRKALVMGIIDLSERLEEVTD